MIRKNSDQNWCPVTESCVTAFFLSLLKEQRLKCREIKDGWREYYLNLTSVCAISVCDELQSLAFPWYNTPGFDVYEIKDIWKTYSMSSMTLFFWGRGNNKFSFLVFSICLAHCRYGFCTKVRLRSNTSETPLQIHLQALRYV